MIQRFGGALKLNIHFHALVLDGVFVERDDDTVRFERAPVTLSTACSTRSSRARSASSPGTESLCRYLLRPSISNDRHTRGPDGRIALRLKTPYRDGSTHFLFDAIELVERLAALVPRPFAPKSDRTERLAEVPPLSSGDALGTGDGQFVPRCGARVRGSIATVRGRAIATTRARAAPEPDRRRL